MNHLGEQNEQIIKWNTPNKLANYDFCPVAKKFEINKNTSKKQKGEFMYTAIKDYCSNGIENGLLLLDMPTGFGKTYNVLKYIYDASMEEANAKRKFFFVTTLKKNLPKEDLEKHFRDGGHLAEFKEKFLFIDSNADCVIQYLTEELEKRIPIEIQKTDEFKTMRNDIRFLRESQKNIDKKGLRPYTASIKENLMGRSEPAFRRYVQAILAREFKTVKDRIYAIKTDEKWQWLGELYPAVFTSDKQIIFMSMDKFLVRNATIVEPSYMFYNSKIIDNAVIFIDEFDATKETILRNIITNGLSEKIDYIELFNDIYSVLHTIEFPKAMTSPSKEWTERQTEKKYKHSNLQFIIDNIREKADSIHSQYSLQFSHKTVSNEDSKSGNFLFQDHQFHAILDGNKSYITTVSDSAERINAIQFSTEKPSTEEGNIQVMLGKLRGFIKYFQGGINMLAYNYMQCREERRKPGEDEFSLESAILSILAEFRLSDKHIDYITSQILVSSHKPKGDIENADFDLSFYENGFRYYAFEDDYAHDMQSKIMMYSFQITPEKILLRFCEKAKVIGISATASVPTVVGNFDHKYLRAKMQSRYTVVAESDRRRLRTEFEKSIFGYNNHDITVAVRLLGEVYHEKIWEGVFDDPDLAQHIFEKVERAQSQDEKNHNKERYFRIAMAYKQFVCHDDIQSFLCVLTKHPRPDDIALNSKLLYEIFDFIHKEHGQNFDKNTVCLLDGEEFDNNKEQIIGKLKNGEKLFVISVYQTIGAGQNLQYGIPKKLVGHLVSSNDRESRGEKDFDAIYLDKPTNIVVNLNNGNVTDEDFVKYLYYVEFLQESAELSAKETFKHVRKAFKTFLNGHPYWDDVKSVYDIKSVVLMSTRIIIQAIGRICRTNQKRKKVYVFADYRISESIDFDIDDGNRLLNPEFRALLSHIKEQRKAYAGGDLEDEASLLSVRVNKMINNILREDWTESRMAQWKMLRGYALQHPTLSSSEESSSFIAHNTYVRLPKPMNTIYYSQDLDYNKVLVSFGKTKDHPYEVSSSAAKLDLLMKNQNLRNFFKRKEWATTFADNDFILSPPLFNNIYKGALGEMAGRFLLWSYLSLKLTEIEDPEVFELFDYKIENTDIFIDVKNWHERTQFDNNEMLKKIKSKASSCNAKCIIVINVVSEQFTDPIRTNYEDITVVQIPSLIDSNDPNQPIRKALDIIRSCLNEFAD